MLNPLQIDIGPTLEAFTACVSKFETERDYISLSHVTASVDEIVNMYLHGFQDTHEIRLRCYKGYQMERDLKERILKVFVNQATEGTEIVAFDGLVKGHPDLDFMGYPTDCKSVPLDEHLPDPQRLPRKAYWQIQAYMKYKGMPYGLLIYESRETGRIRHYWVRENAAIQREIDHKLLNVVRELGLSRSTSKSA